MESGGSYVEVLTPAANPKEAGYYEKYNDSAQIIIKGLSEGGKYYVKARRYKEGDRTTYSDYAGPADVIPSQRPESIVASCDRYVPTGQPLTVKWTFTGYSLQKSWQIIDSNDTVVAEGTGSLNSTQVSAERLAELAVNDTISFSVRASTGSGFVTSETHSVTIVNKPSIEVGALATMVQQSVDNPYTFSVTSNGPCDLIVIVTSQGAVSQLPGGIARQVAGDTIYSDRLTPVWTESSGVFSTVIALPPGLDFWDLCQYDMHVTAVDTSSGLESDPVEHEFTVEWDRQAPDPDGYVTLTPISGTDADGNQVHAVQIELTPPGDSYLLSEDTEVIEGKDYYEYNDVTEEYSIVEPSAGDVPATEGWFELAGDVYDIYRMDVEKPTLIGQSFPLSHTVVDQYAPFSRDADLFYRVALRTVDGDVEFADIDYTAECDVLRFDWDGGYLELPYGLSLGDSYKKDVEFRKHMNGEMDGYWNDSVERKSALGSDIMEIIQPRDIERTRLLGRYTGPVFVRKPDGGAFEADVQVTDLSETNKMVMHAAFDATEISLTQEFSLPIPFIKEDEEEE